MATSGAGAIGEERKVIGLEEPSVSSQRPCVTPPSPSPSPKPVKDIAPQEQTTVEEKSVEIIAPSATLVASSPTNMEGVSIAHKDLDSNDEDGKGSAPHGDTYPSEGTRFSLVADLAFDRATSPIAIAPLSMQFPALSPSLSGGSSETDEQEPRDSNLVHKQQQKEEQGDVAQGTTLSLGDQGHCVPLHSLSAVPHSLVTCEAATAVTHPRIEQRDHGECPSPSLLQIQYEHGEQSANDQKTVFETTVIEGASIGKEYSSVAQTKCVPPKTLFSAPTRQDSHYRKSTALPPLNTTTVAALTQPPLNPYTTLSDTNTRLPNSIATTSTTTAAAGVRSIGVPTLPTGRAQSSPPYKSSPLPSIAPFFLKEGPVSALSSRAVSANDNNISNNNHNDSNSRNNNSNSVMSLGTNISGEHNPSFASAASAFTSASASISASTSPSSPTDEQASPWILPPIPDFSGFGLTFDKSRTSSTNSMKYRRNNASTNNNTPTQGHCYQLGAVFPGGGNDNGASQESTPRVCQNMFPVSGSVSYRQRQQQQHHQGYGAGAPRSIPDYDPSIFDHIQADDNEAYILWSTPNSEAAGINGSGGGALSPTPILSSLSPQTAHQQTSMPFSEPNGSTSSGKRWSAGEPSRGIEKGKDVQQNDVGDKTYRTNGNGLDARPQVSSVPSSPTASRAYHSQPLSSHKAGIAQGGAVGPPVVNTNAGPSNTGGSGPQALLPENRVLMAATVEKLVEKLTSDIDYTFLTDFFLIYRLFIPPLALLKLLMARFRWALLEDSPQRQIVRVRTFVTLRHWLLNYFEFEFTESRLLRRTLTQGLRDLANHPIVKSSVRDQRIVEELRKHFQRKRKAHCRDMAQMALERPQSSGLRRNRLSRQSSARHPRATNLEWAESALSSKRSSLDAGRIKSRRQAYFSGARDDSAIEYCATGLSQVIGSGDDEDRAKRDDDDEDEGSCSGDSSDLTSSESQSDDDMYEEAVETHFLIHGGGGQSAGSTRHPLSGNNSAADDDDSIDSEDDSLDEDFMSPGSLLDLRRRQQQQLPSPPFSYGSGRSNIGPSQDPAWTHRPPPYTSEYSYGPVHPHSTEMMPEHSSFRSNTMPRAGSTRPGSRPLSYVSPPTDSGSSLVLSPPESPRPVEPYMNPPPRNTLFSSDRKKTWSQYMTATVEQLSKVKRVFLPRSSQSNSDLRRNVSSTSSQSLVVGGKRGGRAGNSKQNKLEKTRGPASNSGYWQDDRTGPHGNKVSRSTTILDSMTATSSAVSSAEGQPSPSYFEDGRGGAGSGRLEQTRSNGASEWSSDDDEHTVHMMLRGIHPYGPPDSGPVADASSQARRYAEESRASTFSRALGKSPMPTVSQLSKNIREENRVENNINNDDNLAGGTSGDTHLTPGRVPILRRTTQKRDRDQRASWMTFSSTSSSVFGALLSQGHIPPGQAIVRDRSEQGNVDRFMERFNRNQQNQQPPSPASPGPIDPHSTSNGHWLSNNGRRRKSHDAIYEADPRSIASRAAQDQFATRDGQPLGQNKGRGNSIGRNWLSRSLANHPHRQTVPIMDLHYLQHKDSGELLEEYRPLRRHSSDVRNTEGWPPFKSKDHHTFSSAYYSKGSAVNSFGNSNGNGGTNLNTSTARNQNGSRPAAPSQDPFQKTLLEGEAYMAALQESQRKGQALLLSNGARTAAQTHNHSLSSPLTFLDLNDAHGVSPQPGFDKSRSNSDPHLLQATAALLMSNPDAESDALGQSGRTSQAKTGPLNYRNMSQQQYLRHQSLVYPHYNHNYQDNSYSQQRSPMNPRFQSIISPTRELVAPRPPTSVVLRYRSEVIAQQLCLIEREQLFRVQWHELLKAAWRKKTPVTEDGAAGASTDIQEVTMEGESTLGNESPNVILLVDRFNLTCSWVTSEILRMTDLETRVRVVEKFIRIAHTCYNHSNFSSLTQVMLGLQAHEVSRLSRTWARVGMQGMKIMHDLVEFTTMLKNWKNLRDAMQDIIDEWGDSPGGAFAPAPAPSPGFGRGESPLVATSPVSSSSNRQSQLGLFSKKSSTVKEKSSKGGMALHSKSVSGPVFPSLMSSLGKDKDKERERHQQQAMQAKWQHQQQQQGQQQHQLHHQPSFLNTFNFDKEEKDKDGRKVMQQKHKGCIPSLAVYLSDLLYNTELSTFIEPKRPLSVCLSEFNSQVGNGNRFPSVSDSSSATETPVPVSDHPQGHPQSHPHHHQYNSSTTTASTMATDTTTSATATSGSTGSHTTVSGHAQNTHSFGSLPPGHPMVPLPSTSAMNPEPSFIDTYPIAHQGMVNMNKHRTIATIIKRILTFKVMASRYPFRKENEVFDWLMSIEAADQSEWQRMSEICEEKQQPLVHQQQEQVTSPLPSPPPSQQQQQKQYSSMSTSTIIHTGAASTVSSAMASSLPTPPLSSQTYSATRAASLVAGPSPADHTPASS